MVTLVVTCCLCKTMSETAVLPHIPQILTEHLHIATTEYQVIVAMITEHLTVNICEGVIC